jgi:hypothetical protein
VLGGCELAASARYTLRVVPGPQFAPMAKSNPKIVVAFQPFTIARRKAHVVQRRSASRSTTAFSNVFPGAEVADTAADTNTIRIGLPHNAA